MFRKMARLFPHFAEGQVVKGFGRGSKELGIPTANFPNKVVEKLPPNFECGIYYGWASLDGGPVHKMVMSVGWNPFYKNEKKTMETHIMYQFSEDFYGSVLKVCLLGYIRPEQNFDSLEALIEAIQNDIKVANEKLDQPENKSYRDNNHFSALSNGVS